MILLKVFIGLIAVIAVFCATSAVVNAVLMKKNISYAESFDAVTYEKQLKPKKDTAGYTVFVTNEDFKIQFKEKSDLEKFKEKLNSKIIGEK
jgi:hypothetical protein